MFYCIIDARFFFLNFWYRLNCSSNDIGLLNPSANPDDYHLYHCPCTDLGVPICPANITQQGELFRYRSVSYDEFYDVAEKNISLWILRTYEELKDARFVHIITKFNLLLLFFKVYFLTNLRKFEQVGSPNPNCFIVCV